MNPHNSTKVNQSYTPESTFNSAITTAIPETITDGANSHRSKSEDRLADVSDKRVKNRSIRTDQQGEITVIHLIIVGVACVTGIIVVALLKGLDGVLLSSGIAAIVALISGFSGYKIGQKVRPKE